MQQSQSVLVAHMATYQSRIITMAPIMQEKRVLASYRHRKIHRLASLRTSWSSVEASLRLSICRRLTLYLHITEVKASISRTALILRSLFQAVILETNRWQSKSRNKSVRTRSNNRSMLRQNFRITRRCQTASSLQPANHSSLPSSSQSQQPSNPQL